MNRQVIITGDDFGLAIPVNEAVEQAYQRGVLTTTSLLIGGAAAADAIVRAQRNPQLRVGLHIAVCEGRPVLSRNEIPDLVNARTGEFYSPVMAALRFCYRPGIRRQLEAEIRAQFKRFLSAGLVLDHVNGHNHLQLHPVVLPIIIKVAQEFHVSGIRFSYEPLLTVWRATHRKLIYRLFVWLVMFPWGLFVKRRLTRAGFRVNDYLFGIYDCGAMNLDLMRNLVSYLPDGVSEIHCHPATRRCPEIDSTMPKYLHEAEFEALTAAVLRHAIEENHVRLLAGFSALSTAGGVS